MSNSKVKGILKGLRYISQIFDGEKEQEIQIGYPTDVKHVAHIGWDGGSVNSPSWMNEFKTSPGFASAPLSLSGDVQNRGQDDSVKWVSEDSTRNRRSTRHGNPQGQVRDLPELPKASRRQQTGNMIDSPKKEKSEKPRQSKKPSKLSQPNKDTPDGSKPTRQLMPTDSLQGDVSSMSDPPDIPKKSRRKKSKDNNSNSGESSRSRSKAQSSDPNSNLGSPSKSSNKHRSLEKNGQYEREVSGLS